MRNSLKSLIFSGLILSASLSYADDFNPAEVIVESLPELSLNTLGTHPTTNPYLWSETPAETLLQLMSELGKASLTPAQRQLVTQLLSLDVTGTTFNDAKNKLGETVFLTERLRALFQQGEWEAVLALLALVSPTDMTTSLNDIKQKTLLLKGNTKEACSLLEEKKSELNTDKMRIACFIANEEKEKAILSYDIYQEKHTDNSSSFALLAENTLHEIPTPLPQSITLGAEDIFLVSPAVTSSIDWNAQTRAVLLTLADLPTTDIPLRIELAEKSALPLDEMKKIYRLPLFNPDLTNLAVKRAYLHQQILETTDEAQKIALFKEWINLVKKNHLLINLAPVAADILNTITPKEDYIDIAFDAVQVFGLENNLSLAEPWFKILRQSTSPIHRKQSFLLIPLWQNMGGGYPDDLAEKMYTYCGNNSLPECAQLSLLIPEKIYQLHEISEDSSLNEATVSDSDKTTQLGEALLRAVLNISIHKDLKKSYALIRLLAQPDKRDALLKEEMIFE